MNKLIPNIKDIKHSRLIWVVSVILTVSLGILGAKLCFQGNSDNIKVYRSYEELLDDAAKNKNEDLACFFEQDDICGVAIFEDGLVKYFSVEELDECKDIITTWKIKDGALEYYTAEGTSFMTIIDGFSFDGEYHDGLCWNEEFNEQTGRLEDIGYSPTKSEGTKLKKFLWKEYHGNLWAHLEPESEAGKRYEFIIRPVPIIYDDWTNEITYRYGRDGWYHAQNIADHESYTAWVIGEKEYLECFNEDMTDKPPRMIDVLPSKISPIRQIRILNGCYWYDEDDLSWENYARVRKMEIWGCNDSEDSPAQLIFSGKLSDEMGWQTVEIPKPAAYDRYRFNFYDFYPGKINNNDIAISEIVFYP